MSISNEELKALKNEINSKEDLRKILEKKKIYFNEKDLEACYQSIIEDKDLNLEELEAISGGKNDDDKYKLQKVKCSKCGHIFETYMDKKPFRLGIGVTHMRKCPNCLQFAEVKKQGC